MMSYRTFRGWLLPLLIFLLAAPAAGAQPAPLRGFADYVEKAKEEWQVPGVAIAVIENDSIVYLQGFGTRRAGTSEPVDGNTVFAIGSSTKSFTAAAIGLLVDDGLVSWDSRVIEHMPAFRLFDPYVTHEVTLRDLLAHRTGVGQAGLLWTGTGFGREEIVHRIRYQDDLTSLRSRFGYNNVLYLAAGQVVPAVTGMSWDAFTERRIFQPLGMTRSSTSIDSLAGLDNVAAPHILAEGGPVAVEYRQIDNVGPAGSINSSAHDVAQWVRMLLNEGSYEGHRVLSENTVAEMQSPQAIIPLQMFAETTPEANFLLYGLGWFLHEYRGRKVVEHGGAIDGMHALVGMIPEQDLGIVVLTNRYPQHLPYALMYRVFDAYLGEPERDWSAVLKAGAEERAGALAPPASEEPEPGGAGAEPTLALSKYAGTYESRLYGTAEIVLEGGQLVLERGGSTADLTHSRYDTFIGRWRSPGMASILGPTPILFTLGPSGEVTSFSLAGFADYIRTPASR